MDSSFHYSSSGQYTKIYYTYNSFGQLSCVLTKQDIASQWVNYSQTCYSYTNAGDTATSLIQQWNSSTTGWNTIAIDTFKYNNGKLVTMLGYGNNQPFPNYGLFYTYDTQGNMVHLQRKMGNPLKNFQQFFYTYNNTGKLTNQINQTSFSNDTVWNNIVKLIYHYNINAQQDSIYWHSWSVWGSDTSAVNFDTLASQRTWFIYDTLGNKTHEFTQNWNSNDSTYSSPKKVNDWFYSCKDIVDTTGIGEFETENLKFTPTPPTQKFILR